MVWQSDEARRRFGTVMTKALTAGPQRIRCQDETVVVLSEEEYQRLASGRKSFLEHLRSGPGLDGVDLTRDTSPMRDVDL